MSGLRLWLMASRPRTLPAAIAPVLVGSAAAYYHLHAGAVELLGYDLPSQSVDYYLEFNEGSFRWGGFFAALAGSVFIQIGTNLANDYSDARRGADDVDRLGPVRVTAAGLVTPRRVLVATWLAFGIAIACGIYMTTLAGPAILVIGVVSILAGVLYTGGPRPYGYAGLGELFVFLFFGLVAVNGSYYVQMEEVELLPFGLSVSIGALATGILVINNIRDIDTDRRAGKNTLAVRVGRQTARQLYVLLLVVAYIALPVTLLANDGPWEAALGLLSAPLAIPVARRVLERADGPSLNSALAGTGRLLGVFALLVSAGLMLAS